MIFGPELASKVLSGEKTMTRRKLSAMYEAGKTYAVQPGRGKRHSGHVLVTEVRVVEWWELTQFDIEAEGFNHRYDFLAYWQKLYPGALPEPNDSFKRIRFQLAPRCSRCVDV